MRVPACTIVDFETHVIELRPNYPPVPVGFSIREPGEKRSTYWAWGHPEGNNCTKEQARRRLRASWNNDLLFQNGKFDVDVACTHLDLPEPEWHKIHDTLYLLFLYDPHANSLSLKPSAERILQIPPTEQIDLQRWIADNIPGGRCKDWGRFIAQAPGDIVGRYANGDVFRTGALFKALYPYIVEHSMIPPYDRERKLMPIMLANERIGVRMDLPKLERDYKIYCAALEKADAWLRKRLRTPDLNLDADEDVADALERCGVVTEFNYTKPSKTHPGGVRSVSKKNLTPDMFQDKKVSSVFMYRNLLVTCLRTFMVNWISMARQSGGYIFTQWNQVRQAHGEDKTQGARTGRFSSTPPLQNIPKNWKKAISEGYVFPAFLNVPPLPMMRSYFLPDDGHSLWLRRDYNQQELRMLSHYEDGELMQGYLNDPRLRGAPKEEWFDVHRDVQTGILDICGLDMPRDPVKILNFGDIYGRGLAALAIAMRVSLEMAKTLRSAKNKLLPGIPALNDAIKQHAMQGNPIRTWGGREYYVEEAKFSKKYGRTMDFYYKLLNYLIQGSSADVTKESIIRYHEANHRGRFLITVHDENNISVPKKLWQQESALLRDVMQSVEVDVPMLSDGEIGPNWGKLEATND